MSPTTFKSNVEGKYTVDIGDHLVLSILENLCFQDTEYPIDFVNSVYYDTPTLALLRQKVASEYLKAKVRLRWYGAPEASIQRVPAYLELKRKEGVQRIKTRKQLGVSAKALAPGRESFQNFNELVRHINEIGIVQVGALFPMIVIRYLRHRFTEPVSGARISLDLGIKYTRVNGVFFPEREQRQLRHGVLEIKSKTGEIPASLVAIKSRVNTRDSFSKYEECWKMYASKNYQRRLTSSRYD